MTDTPRSYKMPDIFFNMLNPLKIDEQLVYSTGKYAEELAIKTYIDTSLKQNKNRAVLMVLAKVNEKGVLGAIEDGVVRPSEMKSFQAYQAEKNKELSKEQCLSKDVLLGDRIAFTCFKTKLIYYIKSFQNEGTFNTPSPFTKVQQHGGNVFIDNEAVNVFSKQKHYFFYSKSPGYGKTLFAGKIIHNFNTSWIPDVHNWANFKEHSQFIVIDEYGKHNRFNHVNWDALKSLDLPVVTRPLMRAIASPLLHH